jgi:hypothetical protein
MELERGKGRCHAFDEELGGGLEGARKKKRFENGGNW